MNKDINYIRVLLIDKEKNVQNDEEQEKIEILKNILKNDNAFFEIPMDTAIGIFDFLGIPKTEMIDLYFKLISPESYKNLSGDYITISNDK